jgi:DNA-binding NarL/FixJ family response regulator
LSCTSASYDSSAGAREAQRSMRRGAQGRLNVSVYQCETCDNYHLRGNSSRIKMPKRAWIVLQEMALGYFASEIAAYTKMRPRTVRWYIEELKEAFGANSAAHLVAIAIALGIIDPKSFVPPLKERTHDIVDATGPQDG